MLILVQVKVAELDEEQVPHSSPATDCLSPCNDPASPSYSSRATREVNALILAKRHDFDVFNALDQDHRGNMSRRQLEAGLRKVGLGKQLTASDFESIAEAFDADGDDRINLHGEWVR